MLLRPEETSRFYRVFGAILRHVSLRTEGVPEIPPNWKASEVPLEDTMKSRDVLWDDPGLLRSFVEENPAGLEGADLDLASSWEHRLKGNFIAVRHLRKHSLFIGSGDRVYAVLGLVSPLEDVVPSPPAMVETILLPFEDRIITDGLFRRYSVTFGPGTRRGFDETIRSARERNRIVTSLGARAPGSAGDARETESVASRNAMAAYRKHLLGAGLKLETVERHLAVAGGLAELMLSSGQPRSLFGIRPADVTAYVAGLEPRERKNAVSSLRRVTRFLRDTDRVPWDIALSILDALS